MTGAPRKQGLERVLSATQNSLHGLRAAFAREEAFRMDTLIAAVLIPIALFLKVTPAERALLIASPIVLLIVEVLNTAVEAAIDRIGPERDPLSGLAKDLASSAVMLALILVAVVWLIILFT